MFYTGGILKRMDRKSSRDGRRPAVLAGLGVPCAFRPEFLDFQRGIHVGNLNDDERITRILKLAIEARYGQPFVTERWGRGVYWQWIGYLPRANRSAKPISSDVSFGCSKLFLQVDTDELAVDFGLQIERGYEKAPPERRNFELRPDWDWQRRRNAWAPTGHSAHGQVEGEDRFSIRMSPKNHRV